jgi:NADH-quinone oxidoreductase subunit E
MLRRLHPEQPESFDFTPANLAWAEAQIAKYPEGRQASAVIPLLWRAQEQEGWVTRPAIEYIARMLGMAYIRVLEVATFYFMFQLQPVGKTAHLQICGTTSCMICGAEELIAVCKSKIAAHAHQLSDDGLLSWEEVECLGSCSNAPMAQIGKDYYEDLTPERLGEMIDAFRAGEVPVPGPQNGRWASEPLSGLTSLKDVPRVEKANASVALAEAQNDVIARITGETLPPVTWERGAAQLAVMERAAATEPATANAVSTEVAPTEVAIFDAAVAPSEAVPVVQPLGLQAPREGTGDDLKRIKGVGPKLEALLHSLGIYHFDQIAGWGPAELAWIDRNLEGFHGRASRDDWVGQSKILADGGETEHSKQVDRGEFD